MKEKLQEDIKKAMKERNSPLLLILRSLQAAFKQVEIDTRQELTDADRSSILQKEIKKRRDALEFSEKANRADLIEQNQKEIAILQGYLGEQFSDEKLTELINGLVASGADNIGKVMGGLNKDHKGKFDGKRANELARQILG